MKNSRVKNNGKSSQKLGVFCKYDTLQEEMIIV
jgi:hypothetical protein